jgi:hypothetical protein
MDEFAHLCGCFVDARETERVCKSLESVGVKPMFADARPGLKGYWQATGHKPVFLTDADADTAWNQVHGTCCGQGFGRGLQSACNYAVKYGSRIGQDQIRIAWEASYIHARRTIGGDTLGRGDGCCVPWIFQSGVQQGILIRGRYSKDLTANDEEWAYALSQPRGPQLPADILAAMSRYRLPGAHKVNSLDEAADAMAAGYFLARGADRATGSTRDANGITGTVKCGGHCEHVCLLFVDRSGDRIWGERNSWRGATSQPHGDATFKLADGSEKPVPDGVGGIRDRDVQYYIDHGDLWTAEPPLNLWGSEKIKPSDLVQ